MGHDEVCCCIRVELGAFWTDGDVRVPTDRSNGDGVLSVVVELDRDEGGC